ncbi:hypothetical protein MNV49_002047 [Pseudohyphozyma bogoriensis]|nr:hypothetical protein MNV49_002047 [Pseudohyphozyma bogoriensis]
MKRAPLLVATSCLVATLTLYTNFSSTMPIQTDINSVTITYGSSSAKIALQGATVYSYIHAGKERLFTSSKSDIAGPAAIRGGIPICWPIFGPPPADDARFNKMKQHGFARSSKWGYVAGQSGEVSDGIKAVFVLEPEESTTELYAPQFHLTYIVTLTSTSLTVLLSVHSPTGTYSSSNPLRFQALLHSYLALPEGVSPPEVTATPLTGLTYADKVQGNQKFTENRETVKVEGPNGEVDRVYFGADDELKLVYAGKGEAKVLKKNLSDVVLWNPGPAKGAAIGDMEEGGAGKYVCLEPGQVGEFVELKKGETWEGGITLAFID